MNGIHRFLVDWIQVIPSTEASFRLKEAKAKGRAKPQVPLEMFQMFQTFQAFEAKVVYLDPLGSFWKLSAI